MFFYLSHVHSLSLSRREGETITVRRDFILILLASMVKPFIFLSVAICLFFYLGVFCFFFFLFFMLRVLLFHCFVISSCEYKCTRVTFDMTNGDIFVSFFCFLLFHLVSASSFNWMCICVSCHENTTHNVIIFSHLTLSW